jgi:hypothetical protein
LYQEISYTNKEPSDAQIREVLELLRETWITIPNVSMFSPLWIATRLFSVNTGFLLCIPVKSRHATLYQNGMPWIPGFISFHGTREQHIGNILHQGLMASPPSHGQIGVWTNICREQALNWTPTALDLIPNLALELESHPQAVHTNSKVQAGNPNRFIIRPEVFESHPALRINAIWMGVPSWNRISWHITLKKQIVHVYKYIFALPLPHYIKPENNIYMMAERTFTLVNCKLAYGSAGIIEQLEVGDRSGKELLCVCMISKAIAQFVWIMMLESINHRREALENFDCGCLPHIFQTFIFNRWPTLTLFLRPKPSNILLEWTIGPRIHMEKIGITFNDLNVCGTPIHFSNNGMGNIVNSKATLMITAQGFDSI